MEGGEKMKKRLFYVASVASGLLAPVVAFAEGELPELPSLTGGISLIASAGTAVLALAVGIVIFRRLKSVIR
jgi:hypothetical protein